MPPLFTRLTRLAVVIVTAFCGSVNATAPDRMLDEAVQLNPSESPVAMKSERRSTEMTRRVVAATHRQRGERADVQRAAAVVADESEELPGFIGHEAMPRTLFGAGSMALSALGSGASVPFARS